MSRLLGVAVALALALAGCGSDANGSASGGPLVVSAAASLQAAFTHYGRDFGPVRFSFAGSDQLAAQIRQGVRPDVFASANTTLPEALYADGLVEKPVVFAGNRLVLAVPAKGSKVASLADVERSGATLAIGSAGVPIGAYTRRILDALGITAAVTRNVVSEETDVKGIVAKVALGEADAGFVYVTDARPVASRTRTVSLPAWAQPPIRYEVAVVKAGAHRAAATAFVRRLRSKRGRLLLRQAGFGVPQPPRP
jgi:molybdate transport system substrate-binding protein